MVIQMRLMSLALLAAVLVMTSRTALAGPPFMTDDPEPIEYQHSEAYVYSTYDKGPNGSKQTQLPAFEYNTSPIEDIHLHLAVPFTNLNPADASAARYGIGDTELGIKYRFVHETDAHPQVGIFPMLELPTGNADRGLGNGRAWWAFPVWLQKSWGDWTTYGGGGRALNSAAGMRDYTFGGWLLQRNVTNNLILGGELFAQGATSDEGQHATFFNVGGYYNNIDACGGCSLLFRVGHSVAGETHTTGYLRLYWSWANGTTK